METLIVKADKESVQSDLLATRTTRPEPVMMYALLSAIVACGGASLIGQLIWLPDIPFSNLGRTVAGMFIGWVPMMLVAWIVFRLFFENSKIIQKK